MKSILLQFDSVFGRYMRLSVVELPVYISKKEDNRGNNFFYFDKFFLFIDPKR